MSRVAKLLAPGIAAAFLLLATQESLAEKLNAIRKDLHSESSAAATSPPAVPRREEKCHKKSSHIWFKPDARQTPQPSKEPLNPASAAMLELGLGATIPLWAPSVALKDDHDRRTWFPDYPYGGVDGAIAYDKTIAGTHHSLIVLQGVYGNDFNELDFWNGRATIEHTSRFGLDTETYFRQETLSGGGHDQLWNGDANCTYRFAQSEDWLFRAGLGINWLGDRDHVDTGFNFTYGLEWYPVKPVIVAGTFDAGRIAGTGLFHGRLTVGTTYHGYGFLTGYDYFRVSDTDIHSWINGIELRF